MSIFDKKKKNEGLQLPYSIVLSLGIFLLTCLFSICFANPAYNPSSGTTWQTNPTWLTCFLAGGYGLLFILDFGIRYSFKKEDDENKITPWIYFALGVAEFALILVVMICYFVAFPGVREGPSWFGRIASAIVVCLLCLFNILTRIPQYLDFKGMFENEGHDLINLTLIGALTIAPQLMLLALFQEHENRDTAKAACIFVIVMCVIVLIVPFFTTKFFKNKKQTHTFSALFAGAMTVIYLIFMVVFHKHYTQEIDPITYKEVYWAMFVYGYCMLVSVGVGAYHGICLYLSKKR